MRDHLHELVNRVAIGFVGVDYVELKGLSTGRVMMNLDELCEGVGLQRFPHVRAGVNSKLIYLIIAEAKSLQSFELGYQM